MFSLAAVLAAMMPLYNLTSEFLLKVSLHDKQTELENKTSDNIRLIRDFCWTRQPAEIQQDCNKNIFPITNLMIGLNYEVGQSIPKFIPLDVLPSAIKDSETQMNAEIETYNSKMDTLKRIYKNENDEFRFYTVPLTMFAGAVAAFAIGLGFLRRFIELRKLDKSGRIRLGGHRWVSSDSVQGGVRHARW